MSESLATAAVDVVESNANVDKIEGIKLEQTKLVTNNVGTRVNSPDLTIQCDDDNKQEILISERKETVENLYKKDSENISEKDTHIHVQPTPSLSQQQSCVKTVSPHEGNERTTESRIELPDVVKDIIEVSLPQTLLDNVEQKPAEASTESPASSNTIDYAKHVTYKEDGSAIYTDPQTNFQYTWCKETNNWIPVTTSVDCSNAFENEHYKWCEKSQKWILKQTQVTETEHYKWDVDKKQWLPKMPNNNKSPQSGEIAYEIDQDGQRIYTDKDGTVFFWDVSKSAWFPKIDEDFMARYQMSYGFIDNTSEAEQEKEAQECNEANRKQEELEKLTEEAKTNDVLSRCTAANAKRKTQQEPPQWFEIDPSRNTKVYVSNLPLDISMEEFADLMGKCGMIMRDTVSQKFKLKLYTEADGQIKGDGLCDYIKVESVDLALKILDEYNLRGSKIRVQRARFQMRGEYNPALKPKRKKKDKEKMAKIKEKLFDWRPEKMRGERSKHEKTVVIKNLFHPELFEKEVQLILDYQNDLREECSKCGTVKKVVIYDRHSEGIGQVNMSSPEEADLVIQMMQGRYFGKRQLTAEHWDGKTKYKVEETQEEIQKRLNTWDKYLETTESSEASKINSNEEQ